ncbi:TPA: ribonuclease P protein component [Candidatus Falkowbacteria bacterium]|nr:MAG: Ribonuclease P protein component [Candidatus Falkowbacteria bacterium GW2011_GWF2_43_32]HBA36283.1 ribonuclease P protein component [Candidatus Falkowbacteria bacterium]
MLPKNKRIRLNKDFDHTFKTGQSFYGQILGIKAAKNILPGNRLGIIINTKVSKKAVVRNRLKRQIREIVKKEFSLLTTGHDLVIIVFPPIIDKNFLEITAVIKTGLKRLGLYKG